jgi:nucleotide-binding universal stress UspA family protein
MKTILVPLDGDQSDASALAFAGPLAKRLSAHLTALYVDPDPREELALLLGDGTFSVTQDVIGAMQARNDTRRAAAEAAFAVWQKNSQLPIATTPAATTGTSCLLVEVGDAHSVIEAQALVADLVVTPLPGKTDGDRAADLSTILFDARRPILAVPPGVIASSGPGEAPVLIAWNGSPEGARALHAGIPLIKLSKRVVIAHPDGAEYAAGVDRAVALLGWHGIKSEGFALDPASDPAAALAAKAQELACGLLVMGAYGHSRLREFVLGGVTRAMLESAPVPVFMVH